jgi:hypothetical protein
MKAASWRTARILVGLLTIGVLSILHWSPIKPRFNEAESRKAAKEQANECARFLVRGDLKSLMAMTPQKIVDAMGGADAAVRKMQSGMMLNSLQGFFTNSAAVGDVQQIEKSHSQVFAVLPEVIDISMPLGFMRTESYLVGVSVDDGRTWRFVDAEGLRSLGNPQSIFPDFSSDLSIPPKKQPVVLSAKVSDPESATRPLEDVAFTSVERAYFKVKVPMGSTIVPPKKDFDVDHYTEVTLPDDNVVIFQVWDDKEISQDVLNSLIETARKSVSGPADSPSDLFDTLHGSGTIVTGTILFIPQCMEVGRFQGNKRAYTVIANYPKEDQDVVRQTLRMMLASFQIKE